MDDMALVDVVDDDGSSAEECAIAAEMALVNLAALLATQPGGGLPASRLQDLKLALERTLALITPPSPDGAAGASAEGVGGAAIFIPSYDWERSRYRPIATQGLQLSLTSCRAHAATQEERTVVWRVQGGVPGERDPRATGTGGGLGAGAYMYRGPGVARGGAGWEPSPARVAGHRRARRRGGQPQFISSSSGGQAE